jgi:hypothetical protein
MRIIKKIGITLSVILVAFLLFCFVANRFFGISFRTYEGKAFGYCNGEWHYDTYPKLSIRLDGPYVMTKDGKKQSIYVKGNGVDSVAVYKEEVFQEVEVVVDNEIETRFNVPLRDTHERSKLVFSAPEKLFAMSDLEGEFDAAVDLLKANGVINDSLQWIYGQGHLVLIGDMVDRGENVVPLLWLMYKLEAEAATAGGTLHYVLGNHEQYILDGKCKSIANKYYGTFYATNKSQKELWSSESELGRWLRSKPVAVKVGSTLFMHAGLSPEFLSEDWTLEDIDRKAAKEFLMSSTERETEGNIIFDRRGILFYRGLAKDMSKYDLGPKAEDKHVENLINTFGVEQVAIGHTIAEHIGYDYGGKVIRVDVHHSGGISEGLLVENGALWRADINGDRFVLDEVEVITN